MQTCKFNANLAMLTIFILFNCRTVAFSEERPLQELLQLKDLKFLHVQDKPVQGFLNVQSEPVDWPIVEGVVVKTLSENENKDRKETRRVSGVRVKDVLRGPDSLLERTINIWSTEDGRIAYSGIDSVPFYQRGLIEPKSRVLLAVNPQDIAKYQVCARLDPQEFETFFCEDYFQILAAYRYRCELQRLPREKYSPAVYAGLRSGSATIVKASWEIITQNISYQSPSRTPLRKDFSEAVLKLITEEPNLIGYYGEKQMPSIIEGNTWTKSDKRFEILKHLLGSDYKWTSAQRIDLISKIIGFFETSDDRRIQEIAGILKAALANDSLIIQQGVYSAAVVALSKHLAQASEKSKTEIQRLVLLYFFQTRDPHVIETTLTHLDNFENLTPEQKRQLQQYKLPADFLQREGTAELQRVFEDWKKKIAE